MANAISLHIGLNSVDPAAYAGWSGPLNACEADADSMARICTNQGFVPDKMLGAAATRGALLNWLEHAADKLVAGDIALISYSGHGGQLPDLNRDEDDGYDETWCLFDGQLLDDELYRAWAKFAADVRVVVFSDSCHSGSIAKSQKLMLNAAEALTGIASIAIPAAADRLTPVEIMRKAYRQNQGFYDSLLAKAPPADPQCTVIQVSGCQDNQLSMDGPFNGAFTNALLTVWREGGFQGNYEALTKAVRGKLPMTQSPNYFVVGKPNRAFEQERAFTAFTSAAALAGKGSAPTKTLTIKVENVTGIRLYDFQFAQVPVPVESDTGEGTFEMAEGSSANLHWTMIGTPNGSMKVSVFDGDKLVAMRPKSRIPSTTAGGFDSLLIQL